MTFTKLFGRTTDSMRTGRVERSDRARKTAATRDTTSMNTTPGAPNLILLRCDEDLHAPHDGHNCRWTLEVVDPRGTTVSRLASGIDDTREEAFDAGRFLASVLGLRQIGGSGESGYEFVGDRGGAAGNAPGSRRTVRMSNTSSTGQEEHSR